MCIHMHLAKHKRKRVEVVAKTEGRWVSETTDAASQGALLELEGAMSGGVTKSLEEVVESNKFHADGMHASEMEGQKPPPCETALAVETVEYESPLQVGAEFSQSVSVPLAPAMLEPLADSSITTVFFSETACYGSLTEQCLETSPDDQTWYAGLGQNNAELSPGADASALLPPAPLDSNEDVELSPSVDASELVPQALHDGMTLHGDLGREDADPSLSFSASALLPPAPLESREDVELSQSVDASELLPQALHITLARDAS